MYKVKHLKEHKLNKRGKKTNICKYKTASMYENCSDHMFNAPTKDYFKLQR